MGGTGGRKRISGLATAVAASTVAAALYAAPPALAGARAEILAPKDGGRVGGDVVARVAVKGKRFRAYLDGRDVTSAFSGSGRIRTAHLSIGDELRLGDADLFVRAGKRFRGASDSAHFEVTQRDDSIMTLSMAPSRRTHAAARLRGRLRKPIESLRIKLNGKRVEDEISTRGRRSFEGSLGAHSGLRYGRNRLQIRAAQRGGLFAVEDISFKVPRVRPLAGAGPDLDGAVGSTTRLDAGSTRPVSSGRELSYRWRLIEKPPGSSASLSDPSSTEPTLTPDVPGNYVVRLAASHPGAAAAVDDVSLTGGATDDVLGLPIQTNTKEGGIQIGPPGEKGSTSIGRTGNWVQLVQIDPGSGGKLAGTSPQTYSLQQSGQLVSDVKSSSGAKHPVKSNALVILTGQGLPQPSSSTAAKNLGEAIDELGGTVSSCKGCPTPTPNGAADLLRSGQWSLIGQRGLEQGYATQNFATTRAGVPGFLGGSTGNPGSLNGYLGQVTTVGYQFVSTEYAEIDTRHTENPTDAPPQNQNTVAITLPDGTVQTYPSAPIAPGAVAWQVVVLDHSDLHGLANGTFPIVQPDGSIDTQAIGVLDSLLNSWVRQSNIPPFYAPLVIIQEFGNHQGQAWPASPSVDPRGTPSWVADTLPPTGGTHPWGGSRFPNAFSSLAKTWNQANGPGSVAGNVGVLTGTSGHDVVANYRRPYWDEDTNGVNNHDQGGFTVVATANAYQRSSPYVQPQPDGSGGRFHNGRVVGILRRNEQSQWELGSQSSNAGFSELKNNAGGVFDAKAYWDLAFNTDPKPFPCSAQQPDGCPNLAQPPSSQELANAEADIARGLFPGSGKTSVRDQYKSHYLKDAQSLYDRLQAVLRCPSQPVGYTCDTWNALAAQILIELSMLEAVAQGVGAWSGFFTYTVKASGEQILKTAAGKVKSNLESVESKVLSETAHGVEVGAAGSDALEVLSALIEGGLVAGAPESLEIVPPTLGAISAVIDLGDEVSSPQYGSDVQDAVANDTEAINAKVTDLEQKLSDRYTAVSDTMEFFGSVFVDDWARLQTASNNFLGKWAFTVGSSAGASTNRIAQAANVAAAEALYEATLPIAFRQWIISPRYARINGLAALDVPDAHTYTCLDLDREGDQTQRDPIRRSTPTSSQTSVAWWGRPSGSSPGFSGFGGPASNYTVRFLKSAADNLRTESYDNSDAGEGVKEEGVEHSGSDAPRSIFDPLFQPVNITDPFMDPISLGLSKDEFFGLPNWSISKLQCTGSDDFGD